MQAVDTMGLRPDEQTCITFQPAIKALKNVRAPEDDWSGLSSAAARRKIQNRLNARASRKRKALLRNADKEQLVLLEKSSRSDSVASSSTSSSSLTSTSISRTNAVKDSNTQDVVSQMKNKHQAAEREQRYKRLVAARYAVFSSINNQDVYFNPLAVKQVSPNIIAYNIHRGFIINLEIMGFDLRSMSDLHSLSPLIINNSTFVSVDINNHNISRYPRDLSPTLVQQTVNHHPFWDCFPNPQFREMVMKYRGQFDAWELIDDLTGRSKDMTNTTNAVILWGEPYLQSSWEATEIFFKKYPVLAVKCKTLIESSNYWRVSRGEPPLRIEELV